MESNHGSTWPEQAKRHPNHVEIGAQPSTEELVNYLHKLACVSWLSDEACSTIERAADRLSAMSGERERALNSAMRCVCDWCAKQEGCKFLAVMGKHEKEWWHEVDGEQRYCVASPIRALKNSPRGEAGKRICKNCACEMTSFYCSECGFDQSQSSI